MTTTTHLVTAEELWNMRDHGGRNELIHGEIIPMPPAGPEHGAIAFEISRLLGNHVREKKLGKVFAAESGFILKNGPDTLRAADGAFVAQSRIPSTGVPKKFWPIAPDLVIEVASPGDVLTEVEEKIDDWINAGVRLVWLVSPTRKTVTIYRQDRTTQVIGAQEQLLGEDVVPGFSIQVNEIFE